MLKKAAQTVLVFSMVFFIAGCASYSIIDESKSLKSSSEQRKGSFESPSSDSVIIDDILLSLNEEQGEPDYNEARTKLANFIQDYPLSKWAGCAQALILTIDNLLALQEKAQIQSAALNQVNKEKEKLSKDSQLSEKVYRTETMRQQQEIELLKKDISILKRLEIQLDRREKMLR